MDVTPEEWIARRLRGHRAATFRRHAADTSTALLIWCAITPRRMADAPWSSPTSPKKPAPKTRWRRRSRRWRPAATKPRRQSGYLSDLTKRLDSATRQADNAKTMLLRTMSHELKTPLNAILGFSDLMGRCPTICRRPDPRICRTDSSGRLQPVQDGQPDHGPHQDLGRPL